MKLVWIFDFHTPSHVRVGERCDSDGVAGSLVKAGIEGVIFIAKCHYGFSYYPTRVGTPHPRLATDLFGRLLTSSRARGLKVASYVSFGIDGAAGEAHPDWRRVYANGTSDPNGWFVNLCPFTPYLEKSVLPQITELHQLYRPDGYWFDTMSALSPCYCAICQAEFRQHSGCDLPTDDEDPLQEQAGKWRKQRGFALVERVGQYIHQLDPKAEVGFNQLGSLSYPEPLPSNVTVLTLDPETMGPQSIPFSLNAAYGSNAPQSCEIMPTIFQGGWGDWSPAPALRLVTTALACWIRGTILIPGDRLHPEGRLSEISQTAMKLIADTRARWTATAPSDKARLAADIVVLHSPSLTHGPDCRLFAVGDPRSRLIPINGMHRLLLDAGCNATVAGEWQLDHALTQARLVVVPEIPTLTIETEERLKLFAKNGGSILFVGRIPSVEDRQFSQTGIQIGDSVWQDQAYLPDFENPALEVLVRGAIHETTLLQASAELFLVPAYDAKPGSRYGWGVGPSSGQLSKNPALTRHSLGSGSIWFLNAPLASDYAKTGNWPQAKWMANLLHRIGLPHRAKIVDSEGNLELTVWEDRQSTWLYLLSHDAEQLVGTDRLWARSTGSAGQRTACLQIALRGTSSKINALAGSVSNQSSSPTHLTIHLNFDRPFAALRIDWNLKPKT